METRNRNKPESLYVIPKNNPNHQSSPGDLHHVLNTKIKLYTSFEEAKLACELIFLKPGEAHTEFYKLDNLYHCVIAIGNIDCNTGHLYLSDSINEATLLNLLMLVKNLIEDASTLSHNIELTLIILNSDINNINSSINDIKNTIPSRTSELINDSSFINELQLNDVEYNLTLNIITLNTDISILRNDSSLHITLNDIPLATMEDVEQLVGLLPEMVTDIVDGTFDESCLEPFTGNSQYIPMTSNEVHEIIENVFNS